MRLYLTLITVLLLAGCTKVAGPQRLDFVNTTRYTSSNRTGLNPADTLASRLYAENTDTKGPELGRIVVTVNYQPALNPFLYPTPLSSFNRDSINRTGQSFVFLDSTLAINTNTFSLFTTYGVRTTTGTERWQYSLYNTSNDLTGSRAAQLSMRRTDSLYTYHDYTLKLVIPAVGVPAIARAKSTRRFLSLRAGLALPAYTVVKAGVPDSAQIKAQLLTDLIILADGLTLVSPDSPTLTVGSPPGLSAIRWPSANRRATLIYPTTLADTDFATQVTDTGIMNIYTTAAAGASTGKVAGPVKKGDVYAFRTNDGTAATPKYHYGLILVVNIPTTTTTTATTGLQLQVRMAKIKGAQ